MAEATLQIKGWKVHRIDPAARPKFPGQTTHKAISKLFTVREAAETFATLARKDGLNVEIVTEYC